MGTAGIRQTVHPRAFRAEDGEPRAHVPVPGAGLSGVEGDVQQAAGLLDGEPRRDDVVDVERGPEPLRHRAVRRIEADRDQRELVPPVDAVVTADPPLAAVSRAGLDGPDPGRFHGGGILRVIPDEALRALGPDRPVIGLELRVHVGRPAVPDPHGPDEERQSLGEAPVAQLAAAHLVLGAPALGHVDQHAEEAGARPLPGPCRARRRRGVRRPAAAAGPRNRTGSDGRPRRRRSPPAGHGRRDGRSPRRRRGAAAGSRGRGPRWRRGWPTRPAARPRARCASSRRWRAARPW